MLLVSKLRQYVVQYKMEQALKQRSSFRKIILTTGEFKKYRMNARELSVSGKMYDIKSFRIIRDQVEILVIPDTEEDNILRELAGYIHRLNNPGKQFPKQLFKFFSLNYLSPESPLFTFIFSSQTCFVIDPYQKINSIPLEIFTPPPQFV